MVFNNNGNKLGFLHKTFPNVDHRALQYWIDNEDFSERLLPKAANGTHIDERTVFETMRDIYFANERIRESGVKPNFQFHMARNGIKSLWKSMTGSSEGWRDG